MKNVLGVLRWIIDRYFPGFLSQDLRTEPVPYPWDRVRTLPTAERLAARVALAVGARVIDSEKCQVLLSAAAAREKGAEPSHALTNARPRDTAKQTTRRTDTGEEPMTNDALKGMG